MKADFSEYPFMIQVVIYVSIAALLLMQSTLIFISARKKGVNAWFWGLIGLLNVPSGAILYYLFVIIPEKKKERKE
ncbi:MAG: transcriptional regulator [Bacillus sp. (in: firmicutes)]